MTEVFSPDGRALALLCSELQTSASYFFCALELSSADLQMRCGSDKKFGLNMCKQASLIAEHIIGLQKPLFIDDIYAHPLIGRKDILFGHCLRSFAGIPVGLRGKGATGTLCTVSTKSLRWNNDHMTALQKAAKMMPMINET